MVILTAFTNYSKDNIGRFVSSLEQAGFTGRKIVIYYYPKPSMVEYLENNGWEVHTYGNCPLFINFQRRKDMSKLILEYKLEEEYICCTDIRDVYFAKTPSDIKEDLFLGYDDNSPIANNEWNTQAVKTGYPSLYKKLKNKIAFNAGVIIGKGKILAEFFDDHYELGLNSGYTNISEPCPGLDQSTVNVLAYSKYKHLLSFKENKYVLHMANLDNTEESQLEGYYIYHQYERNKKHKEYVVNLNKKSYI